MDVYDAILAALVSLCFGAYGLHKSRQAGENVTAAHERRAYDVEVRRKQRHSAQQAARKALEKMPSLRTELKDHKNPTRPASTTWSGDWEEMR